MQSPSFFSVAGGARVAGEGEGGGEWSGGGARKGAGYVGWAHLAEDEEMGLVGGDAQHDQVGIEPVQHVLRVGVPPREAPLKPNILDDFVLPLAGDIGVGQDHLHAVPPRVFVETLVDVPLQRHGEPEHEGRPGRDGVAVEYLTLLRHFGDRQTLRRELLAQALLFLGLRAGGRSAAATGSVAALQKAHPWQDRGQPV